MPLAVRLLGTRHQRSSSIESEEWNPSMLYHLVNRYPWTSPLPFWTAMAPSMKQRKNPRHFQHCLQNLNWKSTFSLSIDSNTLSLALGVYGSWIGEPTSPQNRNFSREEVEALIVGAVASKDKAVWCSSSGVVLFSSFGRKLMSKPVDSLTRCQNILESG